MEKMRLGKTGLMVSPVVFGGIINTDETQATANQYVDQAVNAGVNYFDVAPSYGNAEERLAPALAKYRKDVILACKTTQRKAVGARQELLASLKALGTEYFDVYQLHALSEKEDLDLAFGPGGAMETVLWARQEGLIRHIGFSAHSETIALEACGLFNFDTVLFPMNWAMGLTVGWGDRIAEKVREQDIGLLCMKTLIHRKWLVDEVRTFPKSWCKPIWGDDKLALCGMKYGFHKGGATMVPPGNILHFNFSVAHIDECLKNPLSADELEYLRQEAEKVRDHLIFSV